MPSGRVRCFPGCDYTEDGRFVCLEAEGVLLRVDREVRPTMFRGAIVSEAELELLRSIEDVVRLGHVVRIERDEIVLEGGGVPADAETLYVHCAARGLARTSPRPIFQPGRVTVQSCMWGFACFQFATLGVVEATVDDDDEKNRLCPAMTMWDEERDYLSAYLAAMAFTRARAKHPALAGWSRSTRLNPGSAIAQHRDDPSVLESRHRMESAAPRAAANLTAFLRGARDT